MSQFATQFDALLAKTIADIMQQEQREEPISYIASETLGEVVEKFLILHIRIWNLEDAAGLAASEGDAESLMILRKKLDECDKVVRPRLMAAIGQMLEEIMLGDRRDLLRSEDVKRYGGYNT